MDEPDGGWGRDEPGVHRAEIHRANRNGPVVVAVALVVAVVALLVRDDGTDRPAPPPSTTSTEVDGAAAARVPAVRWLSLDDSGVAVARVSDGRGLGTGIALLPDGERRAGWPVAVGDRLALLDASGALNVLADGAPAQVPACCFDALHPSHEPGHVWGLRDGLAVLVDIGAGETPTVLDLAGGSVVGTAAVGLVATDGAGCATWSAPASRPRPVACRDGAVVAAGGDVVAVADDTGVLRTARLSDGVVLGSTVVDPVLGVEVAVAPDGSAVAVPRDGVVVVLDPGLVRVLGRLPVPAAASSTGRPVVPVWVGAGRFALVDDGVVRTSDGAVHGSRQPTAAIAVRAPSPPGR